MNGDKRAEIYTYASESPVYAMNWSVSILTANKRCVWMFGLCLALPRAFLFANENRQNLHQRAHATECLNFFLSCCVQH
jgi:hypothetical protein